MINLLAQLQVQLDSQRLMERRMSAALMIADRYAVSPPTVVMMFLLPDYQNMTLSEKCVKANITEEELFLCMMQPGFKKFMQDFKESLQTNLDVQSLQKLSETVTRSRTIDSPQGTPTREDLAVEMKVLDKAPTTTVNVQNNNTFYEQARQRALELGDGDVYV